MRAWPHLAACTLLCTVVPNTTASIAAASDRSHPCAAISEDTARLACYDRSFGAAANEPVTSEKPATTPPPKKDFGFTPEQMRGEQPDRPKAAPVTSVAATIARLEKQPTGKFVATLDNDQVWVQRETNSLARVKVGDQVTLRKASLGSYFLVTPDGVATRVRRLK